MNNIFNSSFAKYSKFDKDFVGNIENIDEWQMLVEQFMKYMKKKKSDPLIPKLIHQIWLGPKQIPNKYKKWIKSWLKYNPTWDYIFWDENKIKELNLNEYDINSQNINPGFRSDIVRYVVLKKYGGLYIDTDFECVKSIPNELLKYEFVSCTIFGNKPVIANGMIMSIPNHILLDKILNYLKKVKYKNDIEYILLNSGPERLTKEYFKNFKEVQKKSLILPSNYFYPFPNFLIRKKININEEIEDQTIGIHHWEMSWMKDKLLKRIKRKITNFLK